MSAEFVVGDAHAGERLDRALAALAGVARAQAQRWIEQARVRVNGAPARASQRLVAGDRVLADPLEPTPSELAPEPISIAILHQDDALVVLDKPAGLVVHPAPGHAAGTLVNALLHHVKDLSGIGGEERPGIVHRLDRGTSGVMVVAKHNRAHEELSRQFHDREVEKEYITLVWGVVQAGRRIDLPIGRDPHDRQKMSARARRARSAVTRVVRAEHLRGVSLLRVAIATGRTHQIRVHLSAIGHPVVGDATYGGTRRRLPKPKTGNWVKHPAYVLTATRARRCKI